MTPPDPGRHSLRPLSEAPPTLRLADLLGLRVETTDGAELGTVRDVRLRTSADSGTHTGTAPETGTRTGTGTRLVTEGILLGGRHHEVRWGYDRHPRQGPLAVAVFARLLHRRTSYVPWRDVASLDLDRRVVRVQAPSHTDTTISAGDDSRPGSAPFGGTT